LGRFEEALRCFNEALVLDPHDAMAWNNKGVCLAGLGRHDEAIACYNKALEIDPLYTVAWRAKAVTAERLGRIPDAVRAYRQLIMVASSQDAASIRYLQQHIRELESTQAVA
jgi:Flp pilus assembly protein TadD